MDHTRHIGIFYAKNYTVTLIGAGGIGAITAITLAKMGVGELHIFDSDDVEEINIATQFHQLSDVGKSKVNALAGSVEAFSGLTPVTYQERVGDDCSVLPISDIYISAVDSIASRKEIWKQIALTEVINADYAPWYLDARMGAEYFQLYIVNLGNIGWYQEALNRQGDSDIPDEPCTSKATIYTGCIAAGCIGSVVRKIITGRQGCGIFTYDILRDALNFYNF
jgi:molybdopterin/thiamine biosynthesis adenylyltransferase